MGKTKTKTVIQVSSVSTPLLSFTKDPLAVAVANAIMSDGIQIVDALLSESINGISSKIKAVYRYAESGGYTLGLPQGYTEAGDISDSEIITVLNSIEGASVALDLYEYFSGNEYYFAAQWLYEWRQWDYADDQIYALTQAMWDDLDAQYAADLAFHQAETQTAMDAAITAMEGTFNYDVVNGTDTYHYTDVITASGNVTVYGNRTDTAMLDDYNSIPDLQGVPYSFTFDYLLFQASTFQCTYSITKVTSRTYTIEDEFGGITGPFSESVDNEIIADLQNHGENRTLTFSENVTTPINMVDDYYVAFYEVGGTRKVWLYRRADGTYPILDTALFTESAGVFFPIVPLRRDNADLTRPEVQGTELYLTSKKLLSKLGIDILEIAAAINENPDIDAIDHAYILFGVQLQGSDPGVLRYLGMFWHEMYLRYINGSTSIRGVNTAEYGASFRMEWSSIDEQLINGVATTKNKVTRSNGADYVQFNWQINETQYRQIRVYNPVHTNYIYQGHNVVTDLAGSQDPDNNNFIVPLHKDVVDAMPAFERNRLYYSASQLVFNSVDIQTYKVKWYQSGFFGSLLKVAAIGLAVFTAGSSLAALGAAYAVGGFAAAAAYAAQLVAIALITNYVFKLVVKAIGVDAAFIIAVVAMVGGYVGKLSQSFNITEATWADTLLKVASGISNAIEATIKDEIIDLQGEYSLFAQESDAFSKEIKDKFDQLESIWKELESDNLLDPMRFVYTEPMINFNEGPEDYFNRTVHSGNVGVMAFDAITNYCDLMLKLPEPDDAQNS